MNRKYWANFLPLMQAFVAGKTIQIREGNAWVDLPDSVEFCQAIEQYRIKPAPKTLPWSRDDVPVPICLLKKATGDSMRTIWLVTAHNEDGVSCNPGLSLVSWTSLSLEFLHSTDGKTWNPCMKVVKE